MDIETLGNGGRNLKRLGEIVRVMAKHGLGPVLRKLKLPAGMPVAAKGSKEEEEQSTPVRVRKALEELGPTFIKLGQLLSTREDIIGVPMATELSKLQDSVPPFAFQDAKAAIEGELGKPIAELFASLDPKPIASASLGQAYLGKLKNGKRVVVKVRRPRIKAQIEEDIAIMRYLAGLAQSYLPESRPYGPANMVDEFSRAIHKELDYQIEAKNAQRFYENFKGDATIVSPRVYPEFCSTGVITLEYIQGVKFRDLPSKGFNKRLLAHRLARGFFKMVLEDGFFHADPHPSNVLALAKNRVCFIDFGMAAHVSPEAIDDLGALFLALMRDDVEGMAQSMEDLGIVPKYSDSQGLKRDLSDLMDEFYDVKIEDFAVGDFMQKLTLLASSHGAQMPREYIMLSRGIAVVEGTCRSLDPRFNSVEVFKPFVADLSRRRANPARLLESVPRAAYQLGRIARELPGSLRKLMAKIEAGKLEVEFEHKDMDLFTSEMERASNKLSAALILAALIVGSALVIMTNAGPKIGGFPALGLAGFIASGLLGLWLVMSNLGFRQQ